MTLRMRFVAALALSLGVLATANALTAAGKTATVAKSNPIVFATNGADNGNGFDQHDFQDGFIAWAHQVNKSGGIDGRRVVVLRCNDQGSSDGTAACAQQQIQNSKVMAVEGFSPYSGQEAGPLYKTARLTYVTPFPVSDADFVDGEVASTPGTLASAGGQAYYLAQHGLTRIADMRVDLASTTSYPALIKASIAAGSGGTLVADITHPVTQLDFSAQILQAEAAHAQVIFLDEEQPAIPAIFKAAVANGYTGAFALPPLHLPVIQAAFQTGVTVYSDAVFPDIATSKLPAIGAFRQAMYGAKFASPANRTDMDQGALSGYATGLMLGYAVQQVSEVHKLTRAALYKWIQTHNFKRCRCSPVCSVCLSRRRSYPGPSIVPCGSRRHPTGSSRTSAVVFRSENFLRTTHQ